MIAMAQVQLFFAYAALSSTSESIHGLEPLDHLQPDCHR
jgi:hypothetical protein